MRLNLIGFIVLFLSLSCTNNRGKGIEIQDFSKIKVDVFKKKKVEINSSLRFFNNDDLSIKVVYAEFDVWVNGKDVSTFISKSVKEVPSNGIYELPIKIEFTPKQAFSDLDYGPIKIKNDVVTEVEIKGFITTMKNNKKKDFKLSTKQKVLFSNNKKLYLDENGALQEK